MARQDKDGAHPGDARGRWDGWEAEAPATPDDGVTWAEPNRELILEAISAVTTRGDAISFMASRSNRAIKITLLSGGNKPGWWANSEEQADELLRMIARKYRD